MKSLWVFRSSAKHFKSMSYLAFLGVSKGVSRISRLFQASEMQVAGNELREILITSTEKVRIST